MLQIYYQDSRKIAKIINSPKGQKNLPKKIFKKFLPNFRKY